jgi:hypothetical protein
LISKEKLTEVIVDLLKELPFVFRSVKEELQKACAGKRRK